MSKPLILLLGVSHFGGSQEDLNSPPVFDALAPERQRQVEDLLECLAEFRPNKIAIEAPMGSQKVSREYQSYLEGDYQLINNEIDQIGYRLAKMMRHDRVYPIDHRAPLDFDVLTEYSREHGQEALFSRAASEAPGILSRQVSLLRRTGTLRDELLYLNTDDALNLNLGIYMVLTRIGTDADYPGVALTAEWYRRNLIIFSNLTRMVDSSDDRVLVIFGQGHIPLLKQCVHASPDFDLAHTADYL